MLRPKLTTISLTRADVADVVHRRRFRRYLESAEDDACAAFLPDRLTPVASNTPRHEEVLQTYDSTRDGSRPSSATHSRTYPPLVANLPLPQHPFDLGNGNESAVSSPDMISSPAHFLAAGTSQHRGSPWASQLCLRPKRSSSAATTLTVEPDADSGSSTDSPNMTENTLQDPLPHGQAIGQIALETRGETRSALWSPVRLASPRHISASASSTNPLVSPAMPSRRSPDPFDPSEIHQDEEIPRATTPVSGFWDPQSQLRVYNDSLPASSQPQTPQNLPEARHQGRPNGSYTAPARRSSPPPAWTPTVTRSRMRLGRRRELSPMGLRTPGFGGLYGGMENVDDEAMVEEMARVPSRPGAAA